MSDIAARAVGLSKRYRLGSAAHRYGRLTESLSNAITSPVKKLLGRANGTVDLDDFWALKDVTFDVHHGEAVGIIGRNGAGKTTLLKILSRITEPTEGRARLYGRVGSLLEVGTGFHPELSGKENIYLNGAILGMSRGDIRRRFDEIVEFAEVGRFIETPVKRYSSGMQVRLAFAVAAHLEPEILIIDEVLAVGDVAFQRKCLGKMGDVASEGRTILFVSHNMGIVSRLCSRGIWLDQGKIVAAGEMETVVAGYLAASNEGTAEYIATPGKEPGNDIIRLLSVRVKNREGQTVGSLDGRHPIYIEIEHEVLQPKPLRTGFKLMTVDGTVIFTSTDTDRPDALGRERPAGTFVSRCEIPSELLRQGQYSVSVSSSIPMVQVNFQVDNAVTFSIDQTHGVFEDSRVGVISPTLPWTVESMGKP